MKDATTKRHFNWKVKVEYEVPLIINDKRLNDREIAQLFGAMDGSSIKLFQYSKNEYTVFIEHPYYTSIRKISKIGEEWIIKNISLEIIPIEQHKYYGTRILGYQVKNAPKWGIKRILTTAARDVGQNGYYTWPVLGFNGLIPDEVNENFKKKRILVNNVQELIALENGLQLWKQFGDTIEVEFDLEKESECHKTLQKYLSIRRIKL